MSPETSGAVRHLVTALGVFLVSLGWLAPEAVESFVGNTMAIVVPFVGALVTVIPIWLSIRAKQAASKEARLIAAKVLAAEVPLAAEIAIEKAKAKP